MDVSQIGIVAPVTPTVSQAAPTNQVASKESFSTMLKDAIGSVNEAQQSSDVMTNKLITGQDVELHDVMITAQKASVTLNTALQFRNKAVEAYQEIMRMTV
ncbi:flagellar hook-basal body complex protein FliE [Kurthia sibirica]|uniref:Flagellar hook-basal body complex protein FliE n=1 Tax=Kurthia sibirica TaxID=202750 RepID=A0A2U3AQS4_9BACL|nr:flagellar hook-basal body complex protein FliE [Kurthia sibirica]PWI26893.1 flagellar hook-basal body complex protein FliE [Kurthia sibirica]GEK32567.1 flagellar hook-basal body complex protein FliE [Kurthia sibirica]